MTSSLDRKPYLDTKSLLFMGGMTVLCLQWIVVHLLHPHLALPWTPLLPGIAIFAAAFLLSWAAELAQFDVPPALALVLLALVAVLPEYAVDIYFAWTGGKNPAYVPFATANMTGGNRLLIGLGWALVVFVYTFKARKKEVKLHPRLRLEAATLLIATLYSFVIPFKRTLSLWDTLVFFALFAWYFKKILEGKVEEPEVEEGPVEMAASWGKVPRRIIAWGFFLSAALTIWWAAEPFAEGILTMGRKLGIEEFVLVQWIAPLASESPEFIVAVLFALRLRATSSFNTILSSTVNQWTLLVGALPFAYVLSLGHLQPMHLDARQAEEIFLTSAQSLFGVVVLSNLCFSRKEAAAIFLLFVTQMLYPAVEHAVGIPSVAVRYAYAWTYLGVAVILFLRSRGFRRDTGRLLKVYSRI